MVTEDDENNRVNISSRVIINSIQTLNEFNSLIKGQYNSSVLEIDSAESRFRAVQETNKWIRELTNGKIESIVDEQQLEETSIALVNAFYFKQSWETEFNADETQPVPFRLDSKRSVSVEMMRCKRSLAYVRSDVLGAHLLTLPYKNEKYSFTIILPVDEADFLSGQDERSLVRRLSQNLLKSEMAKQIKQTVHLQMPKFTSQKKIKVTSYQLI